MNIKLAAFIITLCCVKFCALCGEAAKMVEGLETSQGLIFATPLSWACSELNVEKVNNLLATGTDPNSETPIQKLIITMTHLDKQFLNFDFIQKKAYSEKNAVPILQALLNKGANPILKADLTLAKFAKFLKYLSKKKNFYSKSYVSNPYRRSIGGKEVTSADAYLLDDPSFLFLNELLRAMFIYMVKIQPTSHVINDLFKIALDQTVDLLAINSDWDPINIPYEYGDSDVKGKTPIGICDNPDYLEMLLNCKTSTGESLVGFGAAQAALNEIGNSCKPKLQHFINFEDALQSHKDITPFKEEAFTNVKKLISILEKWHNEQDVEDLLIARISDQLHALLAYEVNAPSKDKTDSIRRGDSGKIAEYLATLTQFRTLLRKLEKEDLPLLVNKEFPYGEAVDNVKGKTPMNLATENQHPRCLAKMQNFLDKAQKNLI
jgi:hypothetical protein